MAFMPVYIEKSGDLVGCYHSETDGRTNEQGKIGLLSQLPWTAEMSNCKYRHNSQLQSCVSSLSSCLFVSNISCKSSSIRVPKYFSKIEVFMCEMDCTIQKSNCNCGSLSSFRFCQSGPSLFFTPTANNRAFYQ